VIRKSSWHVPASSQPTKTKLNCKESSGGLPRQRCIHQVSERKALLVIHRHPGTQDSSVKTRDPNDLNLFCVER
jgi:hypothetical protein